MVISRHNKDFSRVPYNTGNTERAAIQDVQVLLIAYSLLSVELSIPHGHGHTGEGKKR
jgi:hypothetical protein